MAFSKTLVSGDLGSVTVSEDGGVASLTAQGSVSLADGAVKLVSSNSVQLDAKHFIDLGFELAASKFPSAAALIAVAKDAVDAELAKI